MDNELMLFDRINVIKDVNKKYDLENNAYIAFSGGKDSVVLSHLVDIALPNNNIPRVFINTGIEYNAIVSFVKRERERDGRIQIVAPTQKVKEMLERVGYPFKSKEYSNKLNQWQRGKRSPSIQKYFYENKGKFSCPNILKYQTTDEFNLKVSHYCCYESKKKPAKKWAKENNKSVVMTGMRNAEGGERENISCIGMKNNQLVRFHPLVPVSEEFEDWFLEKYKIKLCELYYDPFNFKRTGCKGCPYALELQNQLDIMKQYLPAEAKQCEIIWEPVYQEYRRIGYRLRKDDGQMTIYDFLGNEKDSNLYVGNKG